MATDIDICTAALLMVGGNEISSFSDNIREAKLCGALYPRTRNTLLQQHPWRFSLAQAQLAQLADTPLYGYSYAYQLPPNCLRVISTENLIDYQVFEDKLYCNESEVYCTFQRKPSSDGFNEVKFPDYFIRVLELEMAAVLAVALSGNQSKSELFAQLRQDEMRRARNIDSQQQPNRAIRESNFLFTQGRY